MVDGKKLPFWQVTIKQLLILLPVGAVVVVADPYLAVSIVSGGLISIISHLYFSVCALRYSGASAAPWVIRSFYRGEAGKFLITLVGFACVFGFLPHVKAGAVFVGYLGMWLLQIVLTARLVRHL